MLLIVENYAKLTSHEDIRRRRETPHRTVAQPCNHAIIAVGMKSRTGRNKQEFSPRVMNSDCSNVEQTLVQRTELPQECTALKRNTDVQSGKCSVLSSHISSMYRHVKSHHATVLSCKITSHKCTVT